jgi:hypothetical protein
MTGQPDDRGQGPARDIKSGIERFRLGDRPDVTVLYPDVCFASLEAVGTMPVGLLVESVLEGWRGEDHLTAPAGSETAAPFPVASLVVSRDTQASFHPELSNREPVELQVWADGRVTVEIEFQGVDVSREPASWAETVRRVLDAWAGSFGVRLLRVFNDRARSLPDVWNATFEIEDADERVVDLVGLGERALRTAELSMSGWGGEEAIRRLLVDGDVHALLAWQPSAVLELWPSPPEPEEVDLFAADVCALSNSLRGGAVVVGVRRGSGGAATLAPFRRGHLDEELRAVVGGRVHPVPERFEVVFVPVRGFPDPAESSDSPGADQAGVIVVRIPPQDALLRPFLLHTGGGPVDGNMVQSVALVEREGTETVSRSVSAVHTALAAGMALLRGTDET